MAQFQTTSGDLIITIPNCDCGLTGGCEKCKTIIISKQKTTYIFNPFLWRLTEQGISDIKAGRYGELS